MSSLLLEKRNKAQVTDIVMDNKAIIILFILSVAGAIISPAFFTKDNLMNVVRQICASAVMGIGFTCVIASGNLDLSVGSMLGMMGVIMALISKTGLQFGLVIFISLIIGSCCGFINGFVGVQFKLPLFIVTLATGQIFKGTGNLLSNTSPVTGLPDTFKWLGQGYIGPIPVPIYITAIVALIVYVLLNRTILGRHAIATGGNREAARTSGINVNKITIYVYMLMGVCATISAIIMTGRAASAQPAAGQGMEMDAIAAVVIGGTPLSGGSGKIVGTLVGCLIVGVIANVLNLRGIDSNWQLVAKGLLILFAVGLDVLSTSYYNNRLKKA